jgi:hypothetical protein
MSNIEGDLYSLTTYDGRVLEFPDGVQFFLEQGNFAAPPVEFVTRRGYKQHGVTEVDYFLQPRTIEAHYHHNGVTPRDDYWSLRADLIDFLRHNRGGPMTFTVTFPDGRQRSLMVRADPGLVLPPNQLSNNNWDIDETLQFIAFDPIWFDDQLTTLSASLAAQADLVFPITFPIVFGMNSGVNSTFNLTYTGTWVSYPTIVVHGPYTRAAFVNSVTGARIGLGVAIGATATRTIDLTPGSQSLTDENGNNVFSDLDAGSNLVDFNFKPDPEVPNGVQSVTASLVGGVVSQGSAVSMTYRTRYFGI